MPPLSSLSTIDEAREWSDLEAPPAEREDYHSNDLPRKPVLKRDGFCVEDFQFSYLFRPRYQESDLRPCLFPYHQRIGPERRKALMMEDGALRTPHIVAQLKHYAIEFDPEAPKSELKELLRRSFEKGKLRKVPDSITQLSLSMVKEYDTLYDQWKADLIIYWRNKMESLRLEFFAEQPFTHK